MQIENFGSENSDFYSSNYHFGIISEACELDTKIECNLINLEKKSVYFHQNKTILGSDYQHFKDKIILIIGCGSIGRYHVVKSLKNLNFKRMVYLCKEKTWAHNYFDDWIDADHENLINIEETSKRVLEYEKKIHSKFNAIFTYDDYSILVASYLANHFNLPSIPFELAKTIKNKYELRILCEKNGITFPNFFLIKNHEIDPYTKLNGKLDNIFSLPLFKNSKIEFPLIVKNPNGSGKDFIYKCNNVMEFMDCLKKSLILDQKLDLLIEEFYEGIEIDIEILIQDNQVKFMAISDNFPAQEPSFNERGGLCPSIKLSWNQNLEIQKVLKNWIIKLGFQNACLHFEARCKPELIGKNNFLMPIEINQRLGGSETWSMILSSLNVNLIHEAAKISLGIGLNETDLLVKSSNPRWYSISHNFLTEPSRFLSSISIDLEKILNNRNIIQVCISKPVGSSFTSNVTIGWLTLKCEKEKIESIFSNLARALKLVKLTTESIY